MIQEQIAKQENSSTGPVDIPSSLHLPEHASAESGSGRRRVFKRWNDGGQPCGHSNQNPKFNASWNLKL